MVTAQSIRALTAMASPPPTALATAAPTAAVAPAADPRCPPEMARIGRFCIDRWEAHLVTPDESGKVHPHNVPPEGGVVYQARSAPGAMPQGYISRDGAKAACEAAGKRLCAWIEWRRACQGPSWSRWPYGNARVAGHCNSGKDHLLGRLFGEDPAKWTEDDFNDPRLGAEPGFLAATGAHPQCVSPEGLYDMVGNLHEWVIDTVSTSFLRKMKEENMPRNAQPGGLGNGIFMGGFFGTRSEHGQGCFFTTVAHSPSYHDYSTGFRCCKDAKPASSR